MKNHGLGGKKGGKGRESLHCKRRLTIFPSPSRESLVSNIPTGDGKMATFFYSVVCPPPPFLQQASAGHIFKDDVNGFSSTSDICSMGCEWYTDLESLSCFYRAGWVDLRNRTVESLLLKEANPMSCVFQNIDPPPPFPPGECVPSAFVAGGGHTRRVERGVWVQYFGRRKTQLCTLSISNHL
jgi:hypothetical protein